MHSFAIKPVFAPLFKLIAEAKDLDVAHQELTGFLRSPRVCDRTDDDLTLLLAALDGGYRYVD